MTGGKKRTSEGVIRRGHQKGSSEPLVHIMLTCTHTLDSRMALVARAHGVRADRPAHLARLALLATCQIERMHARTRQPNRANACPYPSVAMHSPPCAKGIEDHQRRSGAITCEKMTIAIRDHQRQSEAIGGEHLLLGTRSIGGGHRREAARASLFGTSAVSACTPPRPWSRPPRRQRQPRRRRSPTRRGR